ncbi:MAG: nuclear transport factor 2 family protein, partial [Phormidium sp.]
MTTTMFPGTRASIIKNLIGLFERMDVDTALSNFTEDAHYRFGNYPPAVGKKAIREATMASHLDYIKDISFDIKSMWENADSVICELEINYIRNDGSLLTLPCTDIFRMEGDKVKEMLVYMDPSPLFVAPETKQETILDIAKRLIAAVEANN